MIGRIKRLDFNEGALSVGGRKWNLVLSTESMLYVDHRNRWKSWPIKRKFRVHFFKTSAFSSIYYGGHLTTPSLFITPAEFCYVIARVASCMGCSDFFRVSSRQYRKNHGTQIMRSSPKSSYLFLAVSPVDQFITRTFIKGIIKPKEQDKKKKQEQEL